MADVGDAPVKVDVEPSGKMVTSGLDELEVERIGITEAVDRSEVALLTETVEESVKAEDVALTPAADTVNGTSVDV